MLLKVRLPWRPHSFTSPLIWIFHLLLSLFHFFIIPICLSAACLHCHAPSLRHRRASASCSFALVTYVHMSPIHFRSLFLFHFHLSVRMKIASVVAQQKRETLKAVAVRAVCAIMRLIPPANHYMCCRLTWSSTSTRLSLHGVNGSNIDVFLFPSHQKRISSCMCDTSLWKIKCIMSLRTKWE